MWAMIAVSIAMVIWTALLVWMHVRTEKRREATFSATYVAGKEETLEVTGDNGAREKNVDVKV